MSNTKFEFTGETKIVFGVEFKRIRALRDIARWLVRAGDIGGWLSAEGNLSVEGDAWVAGNARVEGNAWVAGDARVAGNAWVAGNARVAGDAWVEGNARVDGDARVAGNAWVEGDARVAGNARVEGNAWVAGDARVEGDARCLLTISPIGSRASMLTAHADAAIGLRVTTGCFSGSRAEFAAAVAQTHADNDHAKAYAAALALIDLLVDPAP